MPSQPEIYLDVDDVLSEFVPYVLHALGADISPFDYTAYPAVFGWDLIGAANALMPGRNFTKQSFWDSVTHDMWATVPKAPMADDLIAMCADVVGKDNVRIVTAMMPENRHCVTGKLDWIVNNLPSWLHDKIHLCTGTIKQDNSRAGRLLIDDAEHNIDLWAAAGGETLCWPRPWNRALPLSWPQVTQYIYQWGGPRCESHAL